MDGPDDFHIELCVGYKLYGMNDIIVVEGTCLNVQVKVSGTIMSIFFMITSDRIVCLVVGDMPVNDSYSATKLGQ